MQRELARRMAEIMLPLRDQIRARFPRIVRHVDGQSTRYVHLNDLRVQPMREVQAGDPVGAASASDEVGVPVLHFEIRGANGAPMDPMPLLKAGAKP